MIQETNGDAKKKALKGGVYFHPGSGKFATTTKGNLAQNQAEAFERVGYQPANDKELKEYEAKMKDAERAKKIASTRTVHR